MRLREHMRYQERRTDHVDAQICHAGLQDVTDSVNV